MCDSVRVCMCKFVRVYWLYSEHVYHPRYLRRSKKTTDTTDSGYDTTAAGILMRKQQQNSTIKTLVAMSRFKGNVLKEKQESSSEKRATNTSAGEKVGLKQNTKEVPKADGKIFRNTNYTNFSNLVDRRRKIRKEKAQIVTMKTIRAIEILPRKGSKGKTEE